MRNYHRPLGDKMGRGTGSLTKQQSPTLVQNKTTVGPVKHMARPWITTAWLEKKTGEWGQTPAESTGRGTGLWHQRQGFDFFADAKIRH